MSEIKTLSLPFPEEKALYRSKASLSSTPLGAFKTGSLPACRNSTDFSLPLFNSPVSHLSRNPLVHGTADGA